MDNNRLEQEHGTPRIRQTHTPVKDWKRVKDREEELRTISPVFKRLEGSYPQEPAPQEWKSLSQKLANQLESYQAPMFRTVKDKLTATDSSLMHWFWITVALVLLAVVIGIVTISVGAGELVPEELFSNEIQRPHMERMLEPTEKA